MECGCESDGTGSSVLRSGESTSPERMGEDEMPVSRGPESECECEPGTPEVQVLRMQSIPSSSRVNKVG